MADNNNKKSANRYAALAASVAVATGSMFGGQAKADQAPVAPDGSKPTAAQYDPHKFSGPSALAYQATYNPATGKLSDPNSYDAGYAKQVLRKTMATAMEPA